MKTKLLSSLFILVFIGNAAFSQKLNFGIKGGTDIGKITGKSFDEEFKFGYHVGAFVEIKVKKIGIQPELYFSQINAERGTDPNAILNLNSNIKKVKLSYLNLPILVNFYFTKNVAFQVGPKFGIVLDESNTKNFNIGQASQDAFKSGDFGLTAGLQIKVLKFRLYGRYDIGLSNLNDVSSQEKWKSQTIHLGIGFTIL